jgi:hypothetical protein
VRVGAAGPGTEDLGVRQHHCPAGDVDTMVATAAAASPEAIRVVMGAISISSLSAHRSLPALEPAGRTDTPSAMPGAPPPMDGLAICARGFLSTYAVPGQKLIGGSSLPHLAQAL